MEGHVVAPKVKNFIDRNDLPSYIRFDIDFIGQK